MTLLAPSDTESQRVTVRFTVSRGELARALRAINRARPGVARWWRLSWIVFITAGVLTAAGVVSLMNALVFLFVSGLSLLLLQFMPSYMAWLTWGSSPLGKFEQALTFSPSGITATTVATDAHTDWQAVVRTAETREFFLIFSAAQLAHFIPKRSVSDEQAVVLRGLLEACAGRTSSVADNAPSSLAPPLVEVRFEFDPSELTRAGMVAARKSGTLWLSYAAIGVIVLWNTVPSTFAQWKRGGLAAVSIPTLLLGLAPLAIILIGPPLGARWAARKLLRTGPSMRGLQSVGVADWGLQVAGPMHNGSLRWSALMKATETPEFFLFFLTKLSPVFIPKRLLSDAETRLIRALARSGLLAKAELMES